MSEEDLATVSVSVRPKLKYKGGSASWSAPNSFSPSPIHLERCDSPNKAVPISPDTSPRSGSDTSPRVWQRPTTVASKVAGFFRGVFPTAERQQSYAALSRESVADVADIDLESQRPGGSPDDSSREGSNPWAQEPYGKGPYVRPVETMRFCCCCKYTQGPSAKELRQRQRWLRIEIDKKETALQTVRDDMRRLLRQADDMRMEILEMKETRTNAVHETGQAEGRAEQLRRELSAKTKEVAAREAEAAEWQGEVQAMHEKHQKTAKQGHTDVMELDESSSELQSRELTLTFTVSENDERLAAQEEQIKQLRARQETLAKKLAISFDEDHVRITVAAFVEICMDGNKPMQSQQFGAMCRAMQLSDAEIEQMRAERQKRRGSRFAGYVPGGLTRQLSWGSK